MALLQVNMYSESLARMVPVNVIFPADGENAGDEPVRTMYLLHGAYGNYMDWLIHTRIYELAQRAGTAVIMPSGDNATYLDHENEHNNYGVFVGQELVAVTRRMFRLSRKREDT